jgi:protein tyrosine/serine phosphatase
MKPAMPWKRTSGWIGAVTLSLSCLPMVCGAVEPRPAEWARFMNSADVPNFYQVTPSLYRSGFPFPDGFPVLEKLGVRTVINLAEKEQDKARAGNVKLRFVHVPVPREGISDDAVVAVLRLLAKKEDGPFLVHCVHGSDRTGAIIAMHRILVQGWTREAAIREMREGDYGFGLPVFAKYVEGADLAKLRARLAGEVK